MESEPNIQPQMSSTTGGEQQADRLERRRIQNRIAQRKFRQKRNAGNSVQNPHDNDALQPLHTCSTKSISIDSLATVNTINLEGLPAISNTPALDQITLDIDSLNRSPYQFTIPSGSRLSTTRTSSLEESTMTSYGSLLDSLDTTLTSSSSSSSELQSIATMGSVVPASDQGDGVFDLLESTSSDTHDQNGEWVKTIHIAAQNGHDGILSILLQRGNIDANVADSQGRTPLFHATIENHASSVRLLLAHGAYIGRLDNKGRSVLHWAIVYQRMEILRILAECKRERDWDWVDINASDNTGRTPLHLAVEQGLEVAVLFLIELGADLHVKARVTTSYSTAADTTKKTAVSRET